MTDTVTDIEGEQQALFLDHGLFFPDLDPASNKRYATVAYITPYRNGQLARDEKRQFTLADFFRVFDHLPDVQLPLLFDDLRRPGNNEAYLAVNLQTWKQLLEERFPRAGVTESLRGLVLTTLHLDHKYSNSYQIDVEGHLVILDGEGGYTVS